MAIDDSPVTREPAESPGYKSLAARPSKEPGRDLFRGFIQERLEPKVKDVATGPPQQTLRGGVAGQDTALVLKDEHRLRKKLREFQALLGVHGLASLP